MVHFLAGKARRKQSSVSSVLRLFFCVDDDDHMMSGSHDYTVVSSDGKGRGENGKANSD